MSGELVDVSRMVADLSGTVADTSGQVADPSRTIADPSADVADYSDVFKKQMSAAAGAAGGAAGRYESDACRGGKQEAIMGRSFMPDADPAFSDWARIFAQQLVANHAELGVSPALADQFSAAEAAFADAYRRATCLMTRTRGAVAKKDDCRAVLRALAGRISKILQSNAAVDDSTKINLGLTVPKARGTIVRPTATPCVGLTASGEDGLTVSVRGETAGRGKPRGVATVWFYLGFSDANSEGEPDLSIVSTASRMKTTLPLPHDLKPGATVWVAARFVNARQQSGPMSLPVPIRVAGGTIQFGQAA